MTADFFGASSPNTQRVRVAFCRPTCGEDGGQICRTAAAPRMTAMMPTPDIRGSDRGFGNAQDWPVADRPLSASVTQVRDERSAVHVTHGTAGYRSPGGCQIEQSVQSVGEPTGHPISRHGLIGGGDQLACGLTSSEGAA